MKRIIAKIDIKSGYVIKGIEFEGVRKVGDPINLAFQYYSENIDEIIYLDCVASLYNRKIDFNLIKKISSLIQIPLTISGRIRNLNDAHKIFHYGGDKISINTNALKKPKLLSDAAKIFGSQSICVHMQFKKMEGNTYEVLSESGRHRTRINLIDWVKEAQDRGVGEIYLFSIDNDGVGGEIDLLILEKVRKICKVPLLYGGGIRHADMINKLIELELDGACISYALHNKKISISEIKKKIKSSTAKYLSL